MSIRDPYTGKRTGADYAKACVSTPNYSKLREATTREQDRACSGRVHSYAVLYKGSACGHRFLPLLYSVRGVSAVDALKTYQCVLSAGQYILVRDDGQVTRLRGDEGSIQFTEVTGF